MEDQKNSPASDSAVADLAKKLSEGKPMQAGKFSNEVKQAMAAVVNGQTEKETTAPGVTFDVVLQAIKAGKGAHRAIWVDQKTGAINLSLVPAESQNGITGLIFKTGDTVRRAGLHENDILADDWVIE